MPTDTLFLIKKIQPFKSVTKDRLFYDKFDYCLSFHLDEANCLRELSHDNIDELIKRRQAWREIAQQRWTTGKQGHKIPSIVGRRWRPITDKTLEDLHSLAQVLITASVDFKLVVSVDLGYVYTSDLLLLDQVDQLDFLRHKFYTQARVDRPKDTIKLKNPQHQYRSYLKMIKLTAQQKHNLVKFLQNQNASVRLSPALLGWMQQPLNRTQDYFFIDHESTAWLTMLYLVHPGIIRKTMHIIADK
jgi:hypothetical protein